MLTALAIGVGAILYFNFGHWLGKKIFNMASDDTPTEALSFIKKLGRGLVFPLASLDGSWI